MFETVYRADSALARHREGPLAAERARYLQQCVDQGGTPLSLQQTAQSMLWVAERMSPADFGAIDAVRLHEIVRTGARPALAPTTAATRVSVTRPWFKFLGWWRKPHEPVAFGQALDRFVSWMRDERGLTPCTIDQWRSRTATFFRWCNDSGRDLQTLRPEDIDAYFITYGAQRWSRISAGHIAKMLRVFLRHAASTGACSLSWDDVRRVIATASADTERDIRDRAILLLLAVYALRRGEVAALRLDQIDRAADRLHIWRLKRRQPQIYPLVPTVAEALARYVDGVRPKVASAEVFIRTQAPRVPISATGDCARSASRPLILGHTLYGIRARPSCSPTG